MPEQRPNILIFNPDQWRGDVMGHMGDRGAVTPNLDAAVARDCVSFRNAFCQNPVCTPSRCSFMTGWYPHVRGHRTMYHMLHPERGEPNLLATLKDNGYFVWWGGKNDLTPGQDSVEPYCNTRYKATRPIKRDSHDEPGWRGDPTGDNYYSFYRGKLHKEPGEEPYHDWDWANVLGAIDFIRSAPADKPWCIYLPIAYPHPPYAVEEPYYSAINRGRIKERIPAPTGWKGKPSILKGIWQRQNLAGWSEQRWSELRAVYYGMCMRVDDQFGRLMAALRTAGTYDQTAVFLFADHGDFTGDYGLVEKTQNTFEDCLTRVPLVIKPPAGTPCKPRVSEAMVELVDFPATVEALTGIVPGHTHFGRSLLPVVAGETDEHRDATFCEGGRLHGEEQCTERQSTSSTNPSGLYWPRVGLQLGEGPEHTKATMCRTKEYKYVRRLYEMDELYDLKRDPGETTNVVNDPAYASVLSRMRDRMLTWYMETADSVPHETDRR